MTETKYTPTPWIDCVKAVRQPGAGPLIADCHWGDKRPYAEAEANAAHIVRCVNSFDAIVAALEAAIDPLEMYQAYGWPDRARVIKQVRTALKLAGV